MNQLPKLEIHLLGAPQISYNSVVRVERPAAKAQALLYYLAMTGRPHTRVSLASLLWAEFGEGEARRNLRKAIQQLREHFGAYLAIDHHTLGFHSAAVYWVDAVEFANQQTTESLTTNVERLQQAIALYRGDFLEGFYVRKAPDFETWMLSERARLRELMLQGVDTLAVRAASQGDLPQAIAWARRLLALEPWREETHRQLMRWLVQNGQRGAALAQFDVCRRALAEELAVEPEPTTSELYAQILQQEPLPTTEQTPLTIIDYDLVGRQLAWQSLRSAWSKAMQSGPHLVCISGEAGLGKTRLAEELLLYIQREGHATARTRAYALEGRLAYAPLADWLRTPPLQAKLAKLNPLWLSEVARLLPELLIQQPNLPAPQPLTERWQQKQVFEAWRNAFTVDPRPLLLLLDDLQWCDPETLAWLQYLLETVPQTPLLVIGTVRSDEVDEQHPLHKLRRTLLQVGKLTTIELTPLSAEETTVLGAQVQNYALDNKTATRLYQETAGNPLFVVESIRAGVRHGDKETGREQEVGGPLSRANLPPKVYAVIEARLAKLSPSAHTLAQLAATIGRAFTMALLVQASQQTEEQVVQGLDELWQRRILREQDGACYDFSHDRIRDVAYAESSPVKRSLFHQRVAQALEKIHAGNLDPVAGELAGHYQRAGALEQAFVYFRQAAMVAKQLYAHSEEVDYLQKTIATAQQLPKSSVSLDMESDLWYELGYAQTLIHDFSSELVATAWQTAYDLATQSDNLLQRCQILDRLAVVARNRGQWYKARQLGELAVSLAEESGDLLMVNHWAPPLGLTLNHLGELTHAMEYYRAGSGFRDALAQVPFSGSNLPTAGSIVHMAQCLWLLGWPEQALACCRWILAIPRQHIDFTSRFATLDFAGMLSSFLRDAPTVQALGEELTAVCAQYDFPFFAIEGQMFIGWALAQQGDVETGLPLVRQSIDDHRQRGIRMFEPYCRSLLAETLALAGELEDALDEVTAALVYAEECGNCYWNAHLLKLKGDFLQTLSASAGEVEMWYQQAITTARQQGAKSLELRATTSLCRLWQGQGKQVAARQLLAAIYGWFTEGFDTVDLKTAKALLDEL